MNRRWARSLGSCGGKLSREHLWSNGLDDQPQLVVSGFPWCKEEPKVVGADALTSKILCKTHNNLLSPVDAEASTFFKQLGAAAGIHVERRSEMQSDQWDVHKTVVDGPLLERWFIKTAINLCLVGRSELRWHLTDTALSEVPHEFVKAAFGQENLPPHMGL